MVTQSDFTSEEWLQIMTAPQMASMYVTLASPSGPVGIVAETMAASKLVVQAIKETSGNALIDAVAAEYRERAENRQKLDMPQQSRNADELRAQCLQACRDLAALLSEKAPTEADGFVQWVYRAAQSTAEAATLPTAREGGLIALSQKPEVHPALQAGAWAVDRVLKPLYNSRGGGASPRRCLVRHYGSAPRKEVNRL